MRALDCVRALALGLLLAAPAAAQAPPPPPPAPKKEDPNAGFVKPVKAKLELTITAAKAEVQVGQLIETTVTLKNVGVDAVRLPKLAEDRQLVSFEVQLNKGQAANFQKITPSPYLSKTDWPTDELKPGKTWELKVNLPALLTGDLTITAHYGRSTVPKLSPKPPAIVSKPVTVKMVAAKNGGERVRVRIVTSMGPIDVRLFPEQALGTCLHFGRLILEGAKVKGSDKVRKPYYKGLIFHRVIPGFMIQGGCPLGTGLGDAGYSIPAEFAAKGADGKVPETARHIPGRLAMAHSSHKNSAGSQFFICTATSLHLDANYTCFGEVTRGMDVAMTIAEVDTDDKNKPKNPVRIETVRLTPTPKK